MLAAAGVRRRGRPRDPATGRAILGAAREVLADRGFTGTSMAEIAKRAGVGKDSVYRRWDSKESLVKDLMTELAEEHVPVPDVDDPSRALLHFLEGIVAFNTETDFGAIIAGLVGASARNPDLAVAFREFWGERRAIAADIVRRMVDPDTAAETIEHILDQVIGPVYYRILLTGEPISRADLERLVGSIPCLAETEGNVT